MATDCDCPQCAPSPWPRRLGRWLAAPPGPAFSLALFLMLAALGLVWGLWYTPDPLAVVQGRF